MPYGNLLFPMKPLREAVKAILAERRDGYHPSRLRPADPLWTLNGATIRSFRRMMRQTKFSRARIEYAPMHRCFRL